MIKVNTDKAYLLGLLVGGGHIHGSVLQIVLPYKKWGDLKIEPTRAGEIAEDILTRLNPFFVSQYQMTVSFKIENNKWKIVSDSISDDMKNDLISVGLPITGELRATATITKLIPYLTSLKHKQNFITGLVDTVGSLAASHRRFNDDFQTISFEFKGNNFALVRDVTSLLQSIDCEPDQVLWNHPNQHSGTCRYYKNWKKGFKVRVALNDYLLRGGFVFQSKQLSAKDNLSLQKSGVRSSKDKPISVSGRVTLHKGEHSDWLPDEIRGGHYIHNLHFYSVLGMKVPDTFDIKSYTSSIEKYFCPFTCLTKDSLDEITGIISTEPYLRDTNYTEILMDIPRLISHYEDSSTTLLYGNSKNDGFPVSNILQGIAYIVACATGNNKGKRVKGNFIELLTKFIEIDYSIKLKKPHKGTCLLIENTKHAALIGYVNDEFNKTLIERIEGEKIFIREPNLEECIVL